VRPTTTITGGASNTGTTSRNGSSSGGGGGGSSSNPGTNLTFGWFNFDGTLILAITGSAILLSLFAAAILTARKLRDKRSAAAAVTTTVNNTKAEEIKPTATVQRPNPLIRSQASIANEISQHNDAMKNMSSSFFGYSVTIQNPLFIGSPKNNG
jgi:hypothetical protein